MPNVPGGLLEELLKVADGSTRELSFTSRTPSQWEGTRIARFLKKHVHGSLLVGMWGVCRAAIIFSAS